MTRHGIGSSPTPKAALRGTILHVPVNTIDLTSRAIVYPRACFTSAFDRYRRRHEAKSTTLGRAPYSFRHDRKPKTP